MKTTEINTEIETIRKTLTKEQLLFVDYYIKGETALNAYELAGLACDDGYDNEECLALLQAPLIRAYMDAMQRSITENSIMSMEAIDHKLSEIANVDLIDMLEFGDTYQDVNGNQKTPVTLKDLSELTKAQRTAISSIKTSDGGLEIKTTDKTKALDMLIKRRGGYTIKEEIKHTGDVQVVAFVGSNKRGSKND